MATKEKVKQGKHLTVTTGADGKVTLKWDWDALLAEVAAIAIPKKNLVKETEAKVKTTRAKKAEEKTSLPTKDSAKKATTKQPVAKKKPAAKKSAK